MDGLVRRGLPVLYRAASSFLPSAGWQAHDRWRDPAYLVDVLGTLRDVWEHRVDPPMGDDPLPTRAFMYFSHRGGEFGVRAQPAVRARVLRHTTMSGEAFVAAAAQTRPRRHEQVLYSSAGLTSLGAAAQADIHPLAGSNMTLPEAVVWLGAGRPVTHAHYDTNTNLFVQVVGRKAITLWPPASLVGKLAVYPSRHSLHRQSPRRSPIEEVRESAMHVVLDEGDALYIPPYFAHQVVPISDLTVSVALWTDSKEGARKDALSKLPLPWEGGWSFGERLLAASQFMRRILVDAHAGDHAAAREMLRRLLELRYEPLRALPAQEQEGLLPEASSEIARTLNDACGDEGPDAHREEQEQRIRFGQHVAAGARRVADAVRAISSETPTVHGSLPPAAEVSLADYLEEVAEFVSGDRGGIHLFLSRCVLGAWNRTADAARGVLA
jgi:hypothetical protein